MTTLPALFGPQRTGFEPGVFFAYRATTGLPWSQAICTGPLSDERMVLTRGAKQQSTLDTKGINALFQENYNTQYIIHPDEIIADNFAILMLSEKNAATLANYTEGGRELLRKMREVLAK